MVLVKVDTSGLCLALLWADPSYMDSLYFQDICCCNAYVLISEVTIMMLIKVLVPKIMIIIIDEDKKKKYSIQKRMQVQFSTF